MIFCDIGRAYSNMYGIYCLIIFFTTIIALYGGLSEILDHGATFKELGLVIIVIYCMTLLFIICNKAHDASQKVCTLFHTKSKLFFFYLSTKLCRRLDLNSKPGY